MNTCKWRPSSAAKNFSYAGCPALALSPGGYCAPHYALVAGTARPLPVVKRELAYQDDDLLPLSDEELANLRALRELTK